MRYFRSVWNEYPPSTFSGIGIELNGPDNVLTDVIVFAITKIGIKIGYTPDAENDPSDWAGCNILDTVHVWNGGPTQVGFQMDGPRNRMANCYIDGGLLNVTNPNGLAVEDSLFLNTHAVWNVDGGYDNVQNIRFRDNMYCFDSTPQKYNKTNIQLNGDFNKVHTSNIVVEDAMHLLQGSVNTSGSIRSTSARDVLSLVNATQFQFNFSSVLLFDWIDEIIYSVSTDGPIVGHVAREVHGTSGVVVVETSEPTTATVAVHASAPGLPQVHSGGFTPT